MIDIALLKKNFLDKIAINPFQLFGYLFPTIDNGYGQTIREPGGVPELKIYTNPVRIFTEKRPIKNTNDQKTPETFEKRIYIMISDSDTIVDIELEFEYDGVNLRVKKMRPLVKGTTIYGYEYELEEVGGYSGS